MKIRMPDITEIFTESECGDILRTASDKVSDVRIEFEYKDSKLYVYAVSDNTPVCFIRFRWNFRENEKRNTALKILGDEWERGYGSMEWRAINPKRCMPWVCIVSDGSDSNPDTTDRYTEFFAVRTGPAAMCFWQYDTKGVTLYADTRCGGDGVILSGRKITVCEIEFGDYYGISAFEACRRFYCRLCDKPLNVSGRIYGANNWYYAYGNSSPEDIIKDASDLKKRCMGIGERPYMVVDSGWEKTPLTAPWISNEKFGDMAELADNIKALDVRPGIWIRPLFDENFVISDKNSSNRLSRDARTLDPSHPDTLLYVSQCIKKLTSEWGYELVKHDFTCYDIFGYWGFERKDVLADRGWHFYNRSKTSAEIIKTLYETIVDSADENAIIMGCNLPSHLAAGYTHINRTGDDTSGIDWERTRNYGINTLAFRMMHNDSFYVADADAVGITEKTERRLNLNWLKLVSVSGTPLFVSPKPDIITDEEEKLIRQGYIINATGTSELRPLDWMENVCPERWLVNGVEMNFEWTGECGCESFVPGDLKMSKSCAD